MISSWWTADATRSALRLMNSTTDIYVNMMIENHQSVGDIYIPSVHAEPSMGTFSFRICHVRSKCLTSC